jgi:hypothetical protein
LIKLVEKLIATIYICWQLGKYGMRSLQQKTQDMADRSIRAVITWFNEFLQEEPNNSQAQDQLANAEFVMRVLEEYRSDLHGLDIKNAELSIENSKVAKIKKILDT